MAISYHDDVGPAAHRAKAEECRTNAARMRNRAMAASDRDTRDALLKIANQWDVLAGEIDKFLDERGG